MAEVSLADALAEVRYAMATDSRDWNLDRRDAFLYGVLVGWVCEEKHEHDETCDDDAFASVASRHGWRLEKVEQVRAMRRAIRAAAEPDDERLFGADAHMIAGIPHAFPNCTWPEMQCVGHKAQSQPYLT